MYGGNTMGGQRQTSKFKSVFGDLPDIQKNKKYGKGGARKQPVSFFDAHKGETSGINN